MGDFPKGIFISYRRIYLKNVIKLYNFLKKLEFSPFLDKNDLGSGSWQLTLEQEIKRASHFIVLITYKTVERFSEPNDFMRREVEIALTHQKNIIPIVPKNFSFNNPSVDYWLSLSNLSVLKEYNAYPITWSKLGQDFDLIRYLSIHPDNVIHPPIPPHLKNYRRGIIVIGQDKHINISEHRIMSAEELKSHYEKMNQYSDDIEEIPMSKMADAFDIFTEQLKDMYSKMTPLVLGLQNYMKDVAEEINRSLTANTPYIMGMGSIIHGTLDNAVLVAGSDRLRESIQSLSDPMSNSLRAAINALGNQSTVDALGINPKAFDSLLTFGVASNESLKEALQALGMPRNQDINSIISPVDKEMMASVFGMSNQIAATIGDFSALATPFGFTMVGMGFFDDE